MVLGDATRIGIGRSAEVYAWGEGRALKLFHRREAVAVAENEYRATAAAHAAGLPAPEVFGMEQVEGRTGIVMERVEGPSLLTVLTAQPWRLFWAAHRLAEVQAALHARRGVPGLAALGGRLRWWMDKPGLPAPLREKALAALARMPEGDAVCHFDFHPDNVVLTRRGPLVIDWSEATAGHPLADVVRTSLMLRFASPPHGRLGLAVQAGRRLLHAAYLRRYLEATGHRREAMDAFLLPVAAARSAQQIEDERPALLALLERLAA